MAGRKEVEMALNIIAKYSGSNAISKAQRDLEGVGKAITNLNKIKGQIESLKQTRKALEEMKTSGDGSKAAIERLTKKAQNLEAELAKTRYDTKNLSAAEIELARDMDALRAKEDEIVKAFGEYDYAVKNGKKSTDDMQGSLDALVASQAFEYIKEGVTKVVDAFKACVSAEMEFEATMSKVQALSGASGSELAALSEAAKEMGATTVYTASESAEALSLMALAGWTDTEMLNGLQPILNLAAASEMDMATATSAVTDNLTAFGMSSEETGHLVDVMAYAMAHSNTTTDQLKEAYKGVAATSKSMGISLEETTAVLMTMANQGVKGSQAGVALNAILTRLATNTSKCADELSALGVEIYDSHGSLNSLSDILTGMSKVWGGLTDAQQASLAKVVAGQRQYNKLQMVLNGCSAEAEASGRSFADFRDALEGSDGAASEMATTMLDNLQGEVTLLTSAFDGFKIAVGEALSGELSSFTKFLTNVVSGVRDWVKENPGAIKVIGALAASVGGVTVALTAATAAKKIFDATMGTVPKLGPIMLITAAIGAVIGLISKWKSEYEEIVPSVSSLTTEARELNSVLSASKTEFEDAQTEAIASSELIGSYVSKLESLKTEQRDVAVRGGDATEVNKRWHETLEELCYVVPELSSMIDLETDSIEGGISALKRHAEATKEDAMAQAYAKYYEKVYSEYSDVLVESAENRVKLTMAEEEGKKLAKEQEDLIKRQNKLREEATKAAEEFNRVNGENSSWENFTTEEYDEIDQKLADVGNAIGDNTQKQKNLKTALEEGSDAEKEAYGVLQMAKTAMDEFNATTDDGSVAMDKLAGFTIKYTEAQEDMLDTSFTTIVEEHVESIRELCEAYEEAYTSALTSVQGQMAIWDESKTTVPTAVGTMYSNLIAQTEYWKLYNSNLNLLSGYTDSIPGLQEFVNAFADGSEESVNAVAGMADALNNGGEQSVADMVTAWQGLQKEQDNVATNIANTTGITEDEISQMVDELKADVEHMNYSDAASEAAGNTFNAYLTTAESWMSRIATTVAERMAGVRALLSGNISAETTADATGEESTVDTGYAVGTKSAKRGFALVGEKGPELVYFQGGEQVVTAEQTKAMAALSYNPISAVDASGASGAYSINVAPVYNISGTNADAVRGVLEQNNASLKSFILSTIRDAQADNRRRAFA